MNANKTNQIRTLELFVVNNFPGEPTARLEFVLMRSLIGNDLATVSCHQPCQRANVGGCIKETDGSVPHQGVYAPGMKGVNLTGSIGAKYRGGRPPPWM